jgi:hypothetical protein
MPKKKKPKVKIENFGKVNRGRARQFLWVESRAWSTHSYRSSGPRQKKEKRVLENIYHHITCKQTGSYF